MPSAKAVPPDLKLDLENLEKAAAAGAAYLDRVLALLDASMTPADIEEARGLVGKVKAAMELIKKDPLTLPPDPLPPIVESQRRK